MEVPRFAAVGLSLMLAANCFMPCYTLAYADESQEVENGEVRLADDGRGEKAGSEGQEDSEPEMDSPSGGAPSPGGALDGSSEDYDSDSGRNALDTRPDLLAGDNGSYVLGGDSVGPDLVSEFGLSGNGEYYSGSSIDDSSLQNISEIQEVNYDNQIALAAIPALPASLVNALSWIGAYNSTKDAVAQFLSWFTGSNKEDQAIIATTGATYGVLNAFAQRADDDLGGIRSYLYRIDNWLNMDNHGKRLQSILDSLRQQWGYNYGTGNTVVVHSNSPAGWLQAASNRLNYNGSLVGGDAGDYSAARLLARIHNSQYGIVTYAETGGTAVRSTVGILGYLSNLTYYNGLKLNEIRSLEKYQGSLNGSSVDDVYGTARLLARLFNMNYQEITYAETGTTAYRSTAGILGYMANLTYFNGLKLNEIRSLEKYQGSLNGEDVDSVYGTARLLARLFNMNYQEVTYAETGTTAYRSTAGILGYIANLTYYNGGKIDTFSNMTSKGFSDVLDKLGSLSVSVEVDFSGVESRLDSIIRLLTVAGVVENAKDVLDAIFGDMSLDVTDAAASAVGSAIQNAFPFCVPAVLKQILGLLQADPAPPEFHFDFWGAPLDFGFSDWQGLADMTSWLSRIGFAVMLFANSRRFVYSGGVAGD